MREFSHLIGLMKRLRSPLKGCPWDLRQTPESLSKHIIEEANELTEAIHSGSVQSQLDELGDLLLQVVFLSRIHQERGNFSIRDVVKRLCRKLVRRHPHIFGTMRAETADEVKKLWEQVKLEEKGRESVISTYPVSMPALSVAARIGGQAANIGFDWSRLPSVRESAHHEWKAARAAMDKIPEEMTELLQALDKGNQSGIQEEIGDLLFSVVNVSRLLGVDAESALRGANLKFTRRFRRMEAKLREAGHSADEIELVELEALWESVKKEPDHDT